MGYSFLLLCTALAIAANVGKLDKMNFVKGFKLHWTILM